MMTAAQHKTRGILLLVSFFIVLVCIFLPIFNTPHKQKATGLDYLDNFFNELSKGSAYYIGDQIKEADTLAGQAFSATLKMKSPEQAENAAKLFTTNAIEATAADASVTVQGDFGVMLTAMLKDADMMYHNNGAPLVEKYGMDERRVLNGWYITLIALEKDLTDSEEFNKAKIVKNCMTKAVEPAYNFYQIDAKSVKDEVIPLIVALTFYVVYTMWFGFGLLHIFEGLGIKLDH
ncbi:MAG: hypothetical protein ACOX5Z_05475 [Desulfobulbus sp.]|jgi:hypothetical protein